MNTTGSLACACAIATWLLFVCAQPISAAAAPAVPKAIRPGLEALSAEQMLRSIRVLASDEFEGRGPATAGEERTIAWLTEQSRGLGLKPGNPDGSWIQLVPMVGITAESPENAFQVSGQRSSLKFPDDCVVWSKRCVPEVEVRDSEVVFVGYGVVAPEYGWDDFKDVDVRGKTLLVLVNDPQIPSERDPEKLDVNLFKGKEMTYYGRWTYKFEMAAKKGAAAAIIVHEQELAGYPWAVVVESNSRENFDLRVPDGNAGRASIEGWIRLDQAGKLCGAAGFDLQALKRAALNKDFKPVPLGIRASFKLKNRIREVESRNFVALLEGGSRKLRNEVVVYAAHWDHLGQDASSGERRIYRGAVDNASGVAGLLELAKAFRKLPHPPKRSILFFSPTAEEKGLLGARYYVEHPLYPLASTVAVLNMDGCNPWGRTTDLEIVGAGNSSLDEVLEAAAATQKRTVRPQTHPERGGFFRSDHFEFVKAGVPALYFDAGITVIGKPADFGLKRAEEYVSRDYHKPSDDVKAGWDLSGAIEDLALLFQVGWTVAEEDRRPVWKPGSEFGKRIVP